MPENSHKFLFKTVPIDDTCEDCTDVWDSPDLIQDTKLVIIYGAKVAFTNRDSAYMEPTSPELKYREFDTTILDLETEYRNLLKLSKE